MPSTGTTQVVAAAGHSAWESDSNRHCTCGRRWLAATETLPGKSNPHCAAVEFATSLRGLRRHLSAANPLRPHRLRARLLPRCRMENAIKEQLDLFCDRTSASVLPVNRLRLLFSDFASLHSGALHHALPGTQLATPPPSRYASGSPGSEPGSRSRSEGSRLPRTPRIPLQPNSPGSRPDCPGVGPPTSVTSMEPTGFEPVTSYLQSASEKLSVTARNRPSSIRTARSAALADRRHLNPSY